MKRLPFLLLAVALPLVIAGCAQTSDMASDTMASGGGVVNTPVEGGTDAAMKLLSANTSASNTIVENAMAVPNLSNLVEAVKAAGLVETLSGPGPFTVFAPVNEAFDLVDKTEFKMMMSEDKQEQLAQLLKSHVTSGKAMYGELSDGQQVVMLSGADLVASIDEDDAFAKQIGEADILVYDIESSNGVIHVINLVLDDEGFFSQ